MPTSYVSRKLKVYSAKNFRDSFAHSSQDDDVVVGYVFIGKATPFLDENSPDEIIDSVQQEKRSWDTMIAAKRIVPGDVEFVIPLQRWTVNTRYKQYDDTLPLEDLLTTSQDGDDTVYPMYVINSENNVYKCLCNNVSGFSMVEPTGNYSENDGFIQTEVGGNTCYLWKYLFNIRDSNKFLTTEWIPVPFPIANTVSSDYDMSPLNLVDGSLSKIVVTEGGSGYVHSTVNVASFAANTNILFITDDITLANSNVKVNMSVSGQGIFQGTYISDVYTTNNRILLSTATISSGGGTSNTINVTTRIAISGDGTGTIASARLDEETGAITKIDVSSIGRDYSKATITIYGSGTGATARAILPPKYGHGYNPAMELGANNVMIVQRIGEVDATENGLIPTDTSFRQYGVVLDPYKYNENVPISRATANGVIAQTTDITVLAGSSYTTNEFVYQGTSVETATFYGYVVSQTLDTIKLNDVYGTPQVGSVLIGANSATTRTVAGFKTPDLKAYTGDIIYAQNIVAVQRSDGQAEEIKLVFKF